MAVRRRFKPEERAAFTVGTSVEWLHGSHWQPAVVLTAPCQDAVTGCWEVGLQHAGDTTRTISRGAYITGRPGGVRLRVS